MSAGWDAAVERGALGVYRHFKGAHPLTDERWIEDGEWVRDEHRKLARAALTAAVGPGGRILEAADVAALGRMMARTLPTVATTADALLMADLDRLRAVLGQEGAM